MSHHTADDLPRRDLQERIQRAAPDDFGGLDLDAAMRRGQRLRRRRAWGRALASIVVVGGAVLGAASVLPVEQEVALAPADEPLTPEVSGPDVPDGADQTSPPDEEKSQPREGSHGESREGHPVFTERSPVPDEVEVSGPAGVDGMEIELDRDEVRRWREGAGYEVTVVPATVESGGSDDGVTVGDTVLYVTLGLDAEPEDLDGAELGAERCCLPVPARAEIAVGPAIDPPGAPSAVLLIVGDGLDRATVGDEEFEVARGAVVVRGALGQTVRLEGQAGPVEFDLDERGWLSEHGVPGVHGPEPEEPGPQG